MKKVATVSPLLLKILIPVKPFSGILGLEYKLPKRYKTTMRA
jgi:hypothetical protein